MNTLEKLFRLLIGISLISVFEINTSAQKLPEWEEGMLDIHHISTGRGDCAFLIFPDSTTLLIDAGELSEASPRVHSDRNALLRPDNTQTAPEWIIRYIRTFHPGKEKASLDYAFITHYHGDHFGAIDHLIKDSGKGYLLTGITAVGHHIPIKKIIAHGLEDERAKELVKNSELLQNYLKFVEYQSSKFGTQHIEFQVGSNRQISLLKNSGRYPEFEVRNLFGSGKIWNGYSDDQYFISFPEAADIRFNDSSNGIRISYGKFDYYTGGDITGVDNDSFFPFSSMDAQTAPIIGPVDIATLNHHGNRDSQSPYYIRTIRPQVWVLQNWSSDHPGEDVLRRLISESLYPGERDIYASVILDPSRSVLGNNIGRITQETGHIVIRVYPGGENFSVFVLDDFSKDYKVIFQKNYLSR